MNLRNHIVFIFFLPLEILLYPPELRQWIPRQGIQPDILLSQLFLEAEQVSRIARNTGKAPPMN